MPMDNNNINDGSSDTSYNPFTASPTKIPSGSHQEGLVAPNTSPYSPAPPNANHVTSQMPSHVQISTTNAPEADDITIIHNARLAIFNWTSSLGPIEEWPKVFGEKYDIACCNMAASSMQAIINEFLKGVIGHVGVGKNILKAIEGCKVVMNPISSRNRGDHLLASDLMTTLHCGITILKAHLNIHAPVSPLASHLHSEIRHHYKLLKM